MKLTKLLTTSYCIIILSCLSSYSQTQYCPNLGFEQGKFTNWQAYSWRYSDAHPEINTTPAQGVVSRRHTIITDNNAYDPNTGNALKLIPPGFNYSVRLGDELTWADNSPRCWDQSLRYTMTIDPNNSLLILRFALVLHYAPNHVVVHEPRFRLNLFDVNGDSISDCANYDVYASNEAVDGFHLYTVPGNGRLVQWRDWTTIGVDLSDYIGQTITIEFMTCDCTENFHFGYCYFVTSCAPLEIAMEFCYGDAVATLTAPEGFAEYVWTNSSGDIVGTSQTFIETTPEENEVYYCTLTSVTGCVVTLTTTINRYNLMVDFSASRTDCFNNTVQFTNLSTTNRGTMQYLWDFGDSTTSNEQNPQYTFTTSGLHQVQLTVLNPPSACEETVSKIIESFSPALVGIEGGPTFCPGENEVVLRAYGAARYEWNTGSNNDSIVVTQPGGDFWLIGRTTDGICISDTIRITVSGEEPDWTLSVLYDTAFCEEDTAFLSASGGYSYLWSTGDTLSSIFVTEPGIYNISGADQRGCLKYDTLEVKEIIWPFPIFGNFEFCEGDSTEIGVDNALSYIWNTSDTTKHIYVKEPGWYSVTGTNADGCQKTEDFYINVFGLELPSDTTPVVCNGESFYLSTEGADHYSWNTGDTTSSIIVLLPGIYKVTGTSDVGCTDSAVFIVGESNWELLTSGDLEFCEGDSTLLTASGAANYVWNTGQTSNSIYVSSSGTFIIIGTDIQDCEISDTFEVEELLWTLSAPGDTAFCEGGSAQLDAGGAVNYAWNTGSTSNSIVVETSGNYIVTGTNDIGCKKSDTIHVVVSPIPDAGFTLSQYTVDTRNNQLTGNSANQSDVLYLWDMGDSTTASGPTIMHAYSIPDDIVEYVITLYTTSNAGCINSSSRIVSIVPFVPNVFSPDGDGTNDRFMPGVDLEIIDRNGLLLYKGSDGWDGTYNEQPVDPDTYFYFIRFGESTFNDIPRRGFVSLVR